MKLYQHVLQTAHPASSRRRRKAHYMPEGALLHRLLIPLGFIELAVVLVGIAVLATGCSSESTGFKVRLISPKAANQEVMETKYGGLYQPARSPAFSDLFGG